MEWLLFGAIVAGSAFAARRWRSHRVDRIVGLFALDAAQRLAHEDVTVFGEQLRRLGRETDGFQLDEPSRQDYEAALASYERARRAVPEVESVEEVSRVTETLDDGRYSLACAQARIAGRPLPERRVPCLFNAQHGPSVTDILWTAPGRRAQLVPACADDAARIARNETPEVRQVKIRGQQVPFWEVGEVYGSYNPVFKAFMTAFRST
ncbi:MAG: hypothetical protein ACRDO2_06760 [Nocardioidaceae bacterium]